jgi:hypothetical protein
MPQILDPIWPVLVVALSDLAAPGGRVPSHASNRFGRQPTRHESEEVPAAPLDRILRAQGAARECVSAQLRFEGDGSCHASLSSALHRELVVQIL